MSHFRTILLAGSAAFAGGEPMMKSSRRLRSAFGVDRGQIQAGALRQLAAAAIFALIAAVVTLTTAGHRAETAPASTQVVAGR